MRPVERIAQLFGGSSVAVDIATQHPLTSEDWAAASVLRKLNLAAEVLTEHHEHGGVCAGCLAHCREPDCPGCSRHKPYPCPLASLAQTALCLGDAQSRPRIPR
jgi:hypothetical protein